METNPKPNPDLSAEVASLKKLVRRQMARRKLEIDSLKEQLKLSKSFSQLRIDYERKIGTGKLLLWLVPAVFSVILAAFGWAGYKKLSDFERRIESRLVRETESNIELSRAFTYLSARHFESAIDILNKAFERDPYDAAVLGGLFYAYDETENWEEAESKIERLEKDEKRLSRLNDPDVLNIIGALRVQEGVEDPQKLANGIEWLRKSERLTVPDETERLTNLNVNFWLAAIAKGDMNEAKVYAARIPVRNSTVTLEPWSKVHRWRFFKIWLRKNPRSEPVVQKMWDESRNGLNKMQNGG